MRPSLSINGNSNWDITHLGPVYGITSLYTTSDIPITGSFYVSSFRFYDFPNLSPGLPHQNIYRLDLANGNITGQVSLPGNGSGMGLGNICSNYERHEIFASNLYDGKIYRLDATLNTLSSFDPFGHFSDTTTSYIHYPNGPGNLPYGERIFGIGFYKNRLYFSQWNEDVQFCSNPANSASCSISYNSIWSIAIDPATGDFAGQPQIEIASVPTIPGYNNSSNPVTDIKFNS